MTDENTERPVKAANQRGAARLAAVQALYQMDIGGTGVLEIVAEYEAHRLGQELDGETYLKADAGWFRSIVSGVVRDQLRLDPLIASALQDDWAEVNAQITGDGNRFRKRCLELIEFLVRICREVDILKKG